MYKVSSGLRISRAPKFMFALEPGRPPQVSLSTCVLLQSWDWCVSVFFQLLSAVHFIAWKISANQPTCSIPTSKYDVSPIHVLALLSIFPCYQYMVLWYKIDGAIRRHFGKRINKETKLRSKRLHRTWTTDDKIDEYGLNWFLHLQKMPQNRISLKSYHHRPQGRRTIGRPKKRWREQL